MVKNFISKNLTANLLSKSTITKLIISNKSLLDHDTIIKTQPKTNILPKRKKNLSTILESFNRSKIK